MIFLDFLENRETGKDFNFFWIFVDFFGLGIEKIRKKSGKR